MTLRELSSEICALGFENCTRLDMPLLFATRRALNSIYAEMCITGSAKLIIASRAPSSKVARLHHKGGGAEALPLSGKAYAMTVSGIGRVTVYDGNDTEIIDFNSDYKIIKGFLKSGGRAEFSGDASFDVYNAVTYSEILSSAVADIPDGNGLTEIDVRERIRDFGGFASLVTDSSGVPIRSAMLSDGKITLPSDYSGEINLTYRRLPRLPTLTEPDAQIDVPREYEPLLPLLTAFYVLLDDEDEKAEIYKKAYTEALGCIKRAKYSASGLGYKDVNGWGR